MARVTPARAQLESPYADQAQAAARRTMAREGKCPETFEGRLAWLSRVWADEPCPEAIHGAGVWTGPQQFDRSGEPTTWPTPNGAPQWPAELVGGSAIGSPRIIEPFRRYIEGARTALDSDGYYCRPLAAALARLDRGGHRRPPHPKGARLIWGTCVSRGDWQTVAARRDVGIFDVGVALTYLHGMLGLLWECYSPRPDS